MKFVAVLFALALLWQGPVVRGQVEEDPVASGEAPASDRPASGEQFVAFHATMGSREELDPTLLGVNNMAMKLLPANLRLLTVISVSREIVAGVKYELVVNAMQDSGERVVCHLVIFERPWIVNEWGEKWRSLRHSNCSDGQPQNTPAAPEGTFHLNPVFNRPSMTVPFTEDRMRELEHQILPSTAKKVGNPGNNEPPTPLADLPTTPQSPGGDVGLSLGVQEELDKFFRTQQQAAPNGAGVVTVEIATSESLPASQNNGDDAMDRMHYSTSNSAPVVAPLAPMPHPSPHQAESVTATATVAAVNDADDDQDNNQVQQIVIPVFVNSPLAKMANEVVVNGDDDENNNQRQQQAAAGMSRRRRRRRRSDSVDRLNPAAGFVEVASKLGGDSGDGLVKNAQEEEEAGLDCADKPFQFKKSGCPTTRTTRDVPGGLKDVPVDDAVKDIVTVAMAKLAGSSQKAENLKLVSIERSRVQVVAGKMYHIDVVLKDGDNDVEKKCQLKVWYQLWVSEDPISVDGECDDDEKYTHKRVARSLVGGAEKIESPENDLEIQGYVNDALATYNAGRYGNGHSVHKIVSATVQIVAGTLHRIKVELGSEGERKECLIQVWNRSWLANGKEITVACEGEDEVKSRSRRSLMYDHRLEDRPHHEIRSSRDGHSAKEVEELHQHQFQKFQTRFARTYETAREKTMRYKIFKTNVATIEQLNRHEMGSAKYGLTEFADMTAAEFKKYTGLLNSHLNPRLHGNHLGNPMAEIPDIKVPQSFDWRDRNVISQVKNQGQCGSCWAFSVIGNIEGLNAIKTGKLQEFSEQELVDCDTLDAGCNGGLPDNAYKAIEQIGGLEYEEEYPYSAKKEQCHFNRTMSHVRVKGAVDLPKDEKAMAQWLLANGPISIGLNAAAMQFYKGGVSHPYRFLCRASKIDHGVLIVGFGQSDYPTLNKTLPYWIVKNSWGPSWGERGYYRIYRGDNTCGINSMASSAVLE